MNYRKLCRILLLIVLLPGVIGNSPLPDSTAPNLVDSKGKEIPSLFQEFEKRVLTETSYLGSEDFLLDEREMSAWLFFHLFLEKDAQARERNLSDLVTSVEKSLLTPIYLPVIESLDKAQSFFALHEPRNPALKQMDGELQQLLQAVQADAWIDGVPCNSSLVINQQSPWTNTNLVNLDIQVESSKDKVTEMAFSEDGTVFRPFQPLQNLVQGFALNSAEGHKPLWVIFRTNKGKVGGLAFDSIDFDATPPTASFFINNGESIVTEHKITLHITAMDAFSDEMTMQVKVTDGEPNPPFIRFQNTLETYLLGLGGEKEITLTLRDRFGNTSQPIVKRVTLHYGAP